MTNKDSYIRAALASVLMFIAFFMHSFILGTVAVIIFYTAYTKFCFIYHFFKINKRYSKENYYLSLLPKYKTAPVFIFDNASKKVLFKNRYAKELFDNINTLDDLVVDENDLICHADGRCYQVDFQTPADEDLTLAYFTDVTEIVELNREIEDTQREIIYAMGEIGETRSKETGNHVKRIALYSKELALLYGLEPHEAEILHMASPMHDIGKVGIPDAILNAPRKLNEEEFEVMKTHAQLGYDMLKHSSKPILKAAAIVAREHHEKWDGSGYPRGLKGEDIHIYGRITAVADVFDALGSERVYKKAWELEKILTLLQEQSGKHFDPKLVELFLDNLDKFTAIRDKYKDVT